MVLNSIRTLYPAVILPGISQAQNSKELRKLCDRITESHILNSLNYVVTGHILYICGSNRLIFLFLLLNVCHADTIVLASFHSPAYIILAKRYVVSNVNLILYRRSGGNICNVVNEQYWLCALSSQ